MSQCGFLFFSPLQTQRARAVLRFVNNLINVWFIISACIRATQKHLAPTLLCQEAGNTLKWFYLLANLLQMFEQPSPPPCYNSLKEERGGEKRRKHDLRNLKPIKMAKNWRTVIVCTLQVMQTLSQIFQWLYRWMPWGPSRSPVLAASRSPYLKSKQSTINLFERPLWLLMYPKLEHFTPLVPEIWW